MAIDWIMFIMNMGTLASDFNNVAISTFFTGEAESMAQVEQSVVGLIFASYSFGMFLSSIIVGRLMTGRGRKKGFAILGMLLQAIASALFLIM